MPGEIDLSVAQLCRVVMYGADGSVVEDVDVSDVAPETIAHFALHRDGVACVQISVPDGESETGARVIVRQCDPGLEFSKVVMARGGHLD